MAMEIFIDEFMKTQIFIEWSLNKIVLILSSFFIEMR